MKAPGKSYRKGMTLLEIADMFSDEQKAKEWLTEQRWPDGPRCPHCGSANVQCWIKHPSQTHRCRECPGRKMFSVKTNTVMEGSNIQCREWAVAIYLFTTNLKGISSMKLHRELGIGQKAAWFMLHRLRKAYEREISVFQGPAEVDETYMGGKRKNMSNAKRRELTGRGTAGKTIVVGVKDRDTNRISAAVVEGTDAKTMHAFIEERVDQSAKVFSDDHAGYVGMVMDHESVRHSSGEFVRGEVHTNGIESFWAMLKRAHKGTYHKISEKHMDRYVTEFSGRHNVRRMDTDEQMRALVSGMRGRRLRYPDLIVDNGLSSGARA